MRLKDRLKMLGEESFAQREQVKIAAPPQTNGTFISCVRFLTNFDVGERKHHILVTILCVRFLIFSAAISKHETTPFQTIMAIYRYLQEFAPARGRAQLFVCCLLPVKLLQMSRNCPYRFERILDKFLSNLDTNEMINGDGR